MARTLILGGTRNLGHVTALALLEAGHEVTIINRGQTRDELPREVNRLRADRTDDASMRAALRDKSYDLVLDNTTYTERDARQVVSLFDGHAGKYVFISSGQVYLVREHLERPFREEGYAGNVMPEPTRDSADYPSWLYGIDKRLAEEVFAEAVDQSGFPVTTLRLPMVASERDHYGRIQGYIARLIDAGPVLVPDEQGLPLRHVYVDDVARLVTRFVSLDVAPGAAFNVSYGKSISLDDFLSLLSSITRSSSPIMKVDRGILNRNELLPDCSPFSGRWMSELDNARSVDALDATYASPAQYLSSIVEDYVRRWTASGLVPDSYRQRDRELAFAATR